MVTSRDVPRPKPFPDMLLEAARRLELAPGELLFVGDSHLDREAARAAGMTFVAYKNALAGSMTVWGHRELLEWMGGIRPAT